MEQHIDNTDFSDKKAIAAVQNIKERDYWRTKMGGEPVKYHFFYDYRKTGGMPRNMERVEFRWADDLFGHLLRLSNEYDYTLYIIFAAGLAVLLDKYNYAGTGDIILGAPIYKQASEGDFINTVLPLRNRLEAGMTFKELLLRVKDTVVEANKYQNYPLEALLEYLGMTASAGDFPLFDIAVLLENIHDREYLSKLPLDMIFSMRRNAKSIEGVVHYNASLYRRASIENIIAHYTCVLEVVLADIDIRLAAVDILSEQERKQLLFDFNQYEPGYPKDKTIPQLFAEQVAKSPDSIAVFGQGRPGRHIKHITYLQLNEQSDQLAGLLIEKGALPGTIVGIMMDRSIELLIGLLGILKTGGAYLPINPEYPEERINYMLKDSSAKMVLKRVEKEIGANCQLSIINYQLSMDEPRSSLHHSSFDIPRIHHSKLAYIIYTSGSTGMPKGVPIAHANLSPLLHWGYKHLGIGVGERADQNLSYYFDWSVWEIFITLTGGAALYIASDENQLEPAKKAGYIIKNNITVLHITPTQYSYLVNLGRKLTTLKYLFIGAEKLTNELLKRSFESVGENCRVFNMYGPTEATIISAVLEAVRGEENKFMELTSVPIGKPVGNAILLVLNRDRNLCPVNIPGELVITGDGVAAGYLNNPELTYEKFDQDLWDKKDDQDKSVALRALNGRPHWGLHHSSFIIHHSKFYCTGDLARWLVDGNIEFLGRIDQQVKIRGFRIELGEIENHLLNYPGIKEAVVITTEDKTGRQEQYDLCAYLVTANELKLTDLRKYLSAKLPDYMIPAYFVTLAKLPLTPNGKLDRKALPEPGIKMDEGYIAPRDALEKKLAAIWSEILGIDKDLISINTSFFELGGHSLKANVLMSKIHKELNARIPLTEIFLKPTIWELAEHIKSTTGSMYVLIKPVEKKEYYKLSSVQKRLYILQQMDPTSTAYNLTVILKLTGEIDKEKLDNIFQRLIERHESLRTSFQTVGDETVQQIHNNVGFTSEYYETVDNYEQIRDIFIRPFDLSQAPLLRVRLLKLKENSFELMVDMHHIITDGASQLILSNEFNKLYYHQGEGLPDIKLQYRDYSEWQNNESGMALLKQESYWLKEFAGEFPILTLPLDYVRPAVQSFDGNTVEFILSKEEGLTLRKLAKETNTTLFMNITAVFNVLLAKLSGQEDIIVGTPLMGRPHADLEHIMGMFVNTLPLRNQPADEKKFKAFLTELKNRTLAAHENQEYPFAELVEKLSGKMERNSGRNPIFDVVINLLTWEEYAVETGAKENIYEAETNSNNYKHKKGTAKFDLTLTTIDLDERIFIIFEYCTRLFKPDTIERFITYFRRILHLLAAIPDPAISELEMITAEEKRQILFDFNNTKADYPQNKTIHELFVEQAEKTPDQIAVIGPSLHVCPVRNVRNVRNFSLTYRQLNEQSDQVAGLLIEKGALPGTIVGIMMERSVEMMTALLGILKAGGAYLPIDPGYPEERIDYMLKDSGTKLLAVANGSEGEKLRRWEGERVLLESIIYDSNHIKGRPRRGFQHSAFITRHSNHLCYVIYTSGSTGMPKGVMVEHHSVVNRLNWMQKAYPLNHNDIILQKTTYTFDVSVWELFWWSFQGARVYLLGPGEEKDSAAIVAAAVNHRVTTMHFVPSMLNIFLDYLENAAKGENGAVVLTKWRSLRQVFASGEALNPMQVERFYRLFEKRGLTGTRLINLYGPTEATVDVSYFNCSPGENYERIPIGKPIDNISLYVLDKSLHLQPIGVVGELYIGGAGLARGYLNNPELTSGRFLRNHGAYESYRTYILYKTGDLARWLTDGNIEFLGRIDNQVKIRGFRIELGEIESTLLANPMVKKVMAAVQIDRSGDAQLVAYVVPDETLAYTVYQMLANQNKFQGDQAYYELPNGMPVFYLNRNETDFMYREIFAEQAYLRHNITLPEGSCIFDIGANIGMFSLFANHACKDATIYSFEPAPPLYDLLALNTSLYGTNFKTFNNGISSKEEEVEFTYYPHVSILSGRFADAIEEKETVKTFIHRELEAAGNERPTEEQIDELLRERLAAVRFNCAMKTVSQVIKENSVERIDLLKIDVEKAELDVLEGIDPADWPKIRQLVIEVHDSGGRLLKIKKLLKKQGYKVVIEQDRMLEQTGLYNLYAIQIREGHENEPPQDFTVVQSNFPDCRRYSPSRLIDDLQESLKKQLPDYMVPSQFVLMAKMPLTASGKLDRKKLSVPELKRKRSYEAPTDIAAERLVSIFSEILGIDKDLISINTSFFELGGHSLKANVLAAKISKEFNVLIPLTEIFLRPRIKDLTEYIKNSVIQTNFLEPVEKKEFYSLSSAQERLYVLQQMDPGSTAYNLPLILKLAGEVHEEKLADIFQRLLKRHESLRTSFETVNNEPVQLIHEYVPFEIKKLGVGEEKNFIRPFDLSHAPLMRIGFLKEKNDKQCLLMVDMHHIITDGFSMGVMVKEFISLYRGESLPPIWVQYKDYSEWQNRELIEKGKSLQKQESFWLKEFADEIPVLDLPFDYPKPRVQCFEGKGARFILDEQDTRALRLFARKEGATLYMLLLCIYNIFLLKITQQETLVIGTPTAGRVHVEFEGIIGMFVNTLALKNEPHAEKPFYKFLSEVREKTLQAFANQEYQYEDLVKHTAAARDVGHNPLFDTMFVFQNLAIAELEIPGLKIIPQEYERDTSKFDITLECVESTNHLRCTLEYSTKLFKKETIDRFINYHRHIISAVLQNPHICLAEIDMLPEEEKRRLVWQFNDTEKECPRDKTIYRLFEDQVEKIPGHVALVFKDSIVTYRHFNERADRLANYLHSTKGIRTNESVGVLMERSTDLIIVLVGIMKSGGAYVPLDITQPAERLRMVFNDASIRVAVTQKKYFEKLNQLILKCQTFHNIISINDPDVMPAIVNCPAARPGTDDAKNIAYIMYTSGSSGIPKGVLVEHRTIVNTLWWRKNFYGYNPDSVSLQNPPYFFDSSVTDIFTPLLGGARLVLITENERLDLVALKKIIFIYQVTHFIAVPAFYNVLLEEIGDELSCLKMICAAGEYFPDELVKKHFQKLPQVRITNEYGPTENSVNTTIYELTPDSPRAYIGKPIWNVSIYILNRMQLCPPGVCGEICIGGSSLARGYLNNPELTAEKFWKNYRPYESYRTYILYKTGDLGKWLPDGNLEFTGRLDNQVKIRGIRIEIGEIENRLLKHNNIKEVAVIIREDAAAEKFLCAYIVPSTSADDHFKANINDNLKNYLAAKLPDYMVPSYFIVIDALPLMPNGKINRKALPPIPASGISHEEGMLSTAPRNESEKVLAQIWSEVLGIEKERIGINEDFFESGGHSLRATILASRIHKAFNVKIPLAEIFVSPTIRGLAQYISSASAVTDPGEQKYTAIEPAEKKEYYPLSAAQKRLYLLHRIEPDSISYNMPQEILLEEINVEKLQWVFKELINRHESLRTSFEMVADEPIQRIHDHVSFTIECADDKYDSVPASLVRPFDLSRAPLLRALTKKESNGQLLLWVDIHHIITDGTSQAILRSEFIKLYHGEGEVWQPLILQYKDYSEWQNSEQQRMLVEKQAAYWSRELDDELPVLNLPLDFNRPFIQDFTGNTVRFILTVAESRTLKHLARDNNVTLFMVILAVFNILLARLSGQEDIIVGTPVMGRRHADLERIIGMFINTLPLRNKPYDELNFKAFLNELKTRTLAAYENQEYPFEELVEKVSVKRDMGRNPIFDVMFNLLNQEDYSNALLDEKDTPCIHEQGTSKFDLTLTAVDLGEKLLLAFEYCSRLFEPATIDRFISYFKQLLHQLEGTPDPELADLEIITEEERHEILSEFNNINADYTVSKTIQQLFAEQVERTPDCTALVGANRHPCVCPASSARPVSPVRPVQLTYRQLNEQSDQVPGLLIEKGVLPDTIVGIMMEHSSEMIVGLLGILKAGGAYLPLNPANPAERNDYMLKDSGTKLLVVANGSEGEKVRSSEVEKIFLESIIYDSNHLKGRPRRGLQHSKLAYIIYTSGSTGQPKGVPISHANFSPFLHWGYRHLGISKKDRTLRNLAYYFDWSVWEIFITLTTGASLYFVPDEVMLNPEICIPFICENKITILHVTPSQYSYFINAGRKLETLKYLFLGAEKLTVDMLKQSLESVNADCRVFNMYGPTEATIVSAVYEINRNAGNEFKNLASIPIGAPIANTVLLVMNRGMKMCPVNITGELYISGDGVSAGYLNNPELTAGRFLKNHRSYGSYKTYMLYQTGDLVRWLVDGNIEFLGRIDQQIKIRGFRIELGDIVNHLKTFPGISEAIVIDRTDGERQYLCAYFTAKEPGQGIMSRQLKEHLESKLPGYMVPACFKKIDRIPLNPNGKIDLNLLPQPEDPDFRIGTAYKAPETYLQGIIAEIWQEVLSRDLVGIYDNFHDLGGNSLDFVRVSNKLKKKLGQDIPIAILFTYPTISSLENYLSSADLPVTSSPVPGNFVMLNGSPQAMGNIFFVHEILGDVGAYMEFCQQLGTGYNCWGVEAEKLRNYVPQNATIEETAAKYILQMKEIQPQGPYLLATWSWGGHLGLEMALQLEQMGEPLALLAFFDCLGPDCALGKTSQEFTLETEKNFLRNFFSSTNNEAELEKLNDLDQLWLRAVEILTGSPVLVEQLRLLLIENALALPDYDELTGEELIQYLNLSRTHSYASAHYIPGGKIHTPIHYFAAKQNTKRFENWKVHCHNPLIYHEINGDHHSIFRNKEQIAEFACLFNKILKNLVIEK